MNISSILLPAIMCVPAVVFGSPVTLSFNAASQVDGEAISGSFTYDDDVSKAHQVGLWGDDKYNSYGYQGEPYGVSMSLPGNVLIQSHDYLGIEICDNGGFLCPNTDSVSFLFKANATIYILQLSGPSKSFSGTGIPDGATLSNFWTAGTFYVKNATGVSTLLTATVSSVATSSVPEASSWLYGLQGGVMVIGAAMALRRRSSGRL